MKLIDVFSDRSCEGSLKEFVELMTQYSNHLQARARGIDYSGHQE